MKKKDIFTVNLMIENEMIQYNNNEFMLSLNDCVVSLQNELNKIMTVNKNIIKELNSNNYYASAYNDRIERYLCSIEESVDTIYTYQLVREREKIHEDNEFNLNMIDYNNIIAVAQVYKNICDSKIKECRYLLKQAIYEIEKSKKNPVDKESEK